ncbi:MAG: DUF4174 domain-containing protein [Planctomycetota bacterium]|nr:DUF4174 domain-containing protein [Planctomycetota bacterium]
MLCRLLAFVGLILPGCRSAPDASDAAAQYAESARWTNRLIVLSAASTSDPTFTTQRQRLRDIAPELVERHLLVVELVPAHGRFGDAAIDDRGVTVLQRRWDIPGEGFQAVLVGKDGRAKRRWDELFDPTEMNDLIDSMPMRQDEMRRGQRD